VLTIWVERVGPVRLRFWKDGNRSGFIGSEVQGLGFIGLRSKDSSLIGIAGSLVLDKHELYTSVQDNPER
jgi:hypothetical protein